MKQHALGAIFACLWLFYGISTSAVVTVDVGASGFVFSPDTVTAAAGDVIEFVISSGHSVAQSSFDSPCQPISDSAIYSGFPSNGAMFSVTVNSSDTLWFYCTAQGHCQGGMAMVVNPPSSGNTLAAYQSAARSASGSAPAQVQGGVFGAPSASSSSSSSSSPSSSTSAGSSTATDTATSTSSGSATTSSGAPAAGPYGGNGVSLVADFILLSLVMLGGLAITL